MNAVPKLLRIPHDLVKAGDSAVIVIRNAVLREHMLDAVQGEASIGDAPGVSAEGRPEVGLLDGCPIGFDDVEAEHNVCHGAVAVWHFDRNDPCAVGSQTYLHSVGVL